MNEKKEAYTKAEVRETVTSILMDIHIDLDILLDEVAAGDNKDELVGVARAIAVFKNNVDEVLGVEDDE